MTDTDTDGQTASQSTVAKQLGHRKHHQEEKSVDDAISSPLPSRELDSPTPVVPKITRKIDRRIYFAGGLLVALLVGLFTLFSYFDVTLGFDEGSTFASQPGAAQAAQTGGDMASHHGGGSGSKVFTPLSQGTKAPDFSLPSTTGKVVSLADFRGKNVLLYFNEGVMCDTCWQEITKMEKSKAEFDKLNAVIVPISVDTVATWKPVIELQKITTPILIDSDRKVSTAYHVLGTPSSMHADRPGHTYIHVDPQGNIHSSSDFPSMNVAADVLLTHLKESGK